MTQTSLGKIVLLQVRLKQTGSCLLDPASSVLNSMPALHALLNRIVESCNLHIVAESSHAFAPYGITICKVLSESHISIHTWPEHASFALDVYSCRDDLSEAAIEAIVREALPVEEVQLKAIHRHFSPAIS